jgi:hypothetical protein
VDKFKYQQHDIVHFKDRKMAFPECKDHSKQRCEIYCEQCDVPVCTKCIIGPHKGHDAVELSEAIETKKQEIKKEIQEIESVIIPRYKQKMEDAENKLSVTSARFNELEKEREKRRKLWHQEVDAIFNKCGSSIKSIEEYQLAVLKSHHSKITSLIQEMTKIVQENKKLVRSKTLSEFTNFKSKLGEYNMMPRDVDFAIPVLNASTILGRELRLQLGEFQATLTQTAHSTLTDEVACSSVSTLLEKAKVIASIPTGVLNLLSVACMGVDGAWIGYKNNIIRHVSIQGSLEDFVECQTWPHDITLNTQGELLYSDGPSQTLNIVRHGKTEKLITTPQGWHPAGLFCTKAGDILVSMFSTDCRRYKIVRYRGNKVKQEIELESGQPISKGGASLLWVVENNNGDICASDNAAKMVVAVDKSGRVRFRYDGTPSKRKEMFNPEQLVTDSMSQIIVTDYNNACLHILNANGQFLRCLDNCGLDKPTGVSIDSLGRLWVGLEETGEVKVIQYIK